MQPPTRGGKEISLLRMGSFFSAGTAVTVFLGVSRLGVDFISTFAAAGFPGDETGLGGSETTSVVGGVLVVALGFIDFFGAGTGEGGSDGVTGIMTTECSSVVSLRE